MTPQLAPIGSAILSLAWQGQSGLTYTVQTSEDLIGWSTLPYVVEGNGTDESYFLEQAAPSLFARLCYDSDGDTDDNALPDMWEWEHFGYVGVSPQADPDLDDRSNAEEWLLQSDPHDYYNGEWPEIRLSCGTDWLVPAGAVSSQHLTLCLLKPSGELWAHAPVVLQMADGSASLVSDGSEGQSTASGLLVWTDETGHLQAANPSIQVLAPGTGGAVAGVSIQAGKASAEVRVHAIADTFGPPPRDLRRWTTADGQVYSWTGSPGEAESILIEEKDASGTWTRIIEVATNDLSEPDADSGFYSLTVEN